MNTHIATWNTLEGKILILPGYIISPHKKDIKNGIVYWFTSDHLIKEYSFLNTGIEPGFGFTKDWIHSVSDGKNVTIMPITKLHHLFYDY